MTIAELIESLKDLPQDMEVNSHAEYYRYSQRGERKIQEVEVIFWIGADEPSEVEE